MKELSARVCPAKRDCRRGVWKSVFAQELICALLAEAHAWSSRLGDHTFRGSDTRGRYHDGFNAAALVNVVYGCRLPPQ